MKRLLPLLLLFACATRPSNDFQSGDAEAALRRMADRFAAGARAGNVDEMMSIYAEEAVLLAPNAPAFRGRDAIRQFWSGFLAVGKVDANLIIEDVQQYEDTATEVGRYEMTISPPGAPAPFKDSGKYVIVWRRQPDGGWRAVVDAFNTSLPAPR